MRRPSRLKLAEADILATLRATGKRVFTYIELRDALSRNRLDWDLTRRVVLDDFIDFLERNGHIQIHNLVSAKYGRDINRYSLGPASIYELALSIRSKSYLSHSTAAELHRLLKPDMKTIYANAEQSAKPQPDGPMIQTAIDAAYARRQHRSELVYAYKATEIMALNGKQTGRLGVATIVGPSGEALSATDIERTLIDIAVRPAYAGGALRVLKAYGAARGRISIDRLLATLEKLQHRYPFHQVIGFLMSRSGFPAPECARLAEPGILYDFYVDYDIKQRAYSKDWRVFYPAEFDGTAARDA